MVYTSTMINKSLAVFFISISVIKVLDSVYTAKEVVDLIQDMFYYDELDLYPDTGTLELKDLFVNFIRKYHKNYTSEEEIQLRYELFKLKVLRGEDYDENTDRTRQELSIIEREQSEDTGIERDQSKDTGIERDQSKDTRFSNPKDSVKKSTTTERSNEEVLNSDNPNENDEDHSNNITSNENPTDVVLNSSSSLENGKLSEQKNTDNNSIPIIGRSHMSPDENELQIETDTNKVIVLSSNKSIQLIFNNSTVIFKTQGDLNLNTDSRNIEDSLPKNHSNSEQAVGDGSKSDQIGEEVLLEESTSNISETSNSTAYNKTRIIDPLNNSSPSLKDETQSSTTDLISTDFTEEVVERDLSIDFGTRNISMDDILNILDALPNNTDDSKEFVETVVNENLFNKSSSISQFVTEEATLPNRVEIKSKPTDESGFNTNFEAESTHIADIITSTLYGSLDVTKSNIETQKYYPDFSFTTTDTNQVMVRQSDISPSIEFTTQGKQPFDEIDEVVIDSSTFATAPSIEGGEVSETNTEKVADNTTFVDGEIKDEIIDVTEPIREIEEVMKNMRMENLNFTGRKILVEEPDIEITNTDSTLEILDSEIYVTETMSAIHMRMDEVYQTEYATEAMDNVTEQIREKETALEEKETISPNQITNPETELPNSTLSTLLTGEVSIGVTVSSDIPDEKLSPYLRSFINEMSNKSVGEKSHEQMKDDNIVLVESTTVNELVDVTESINDGNDHTREKNASKTLQVTYGTSEIGTNVLSQTMNPLIEKLRKMSDDILTLPHQRSLPISETNEVLNNKAQALELPGDLVAIAEPTTVTESVVDAFDRKGMTEEENNMQTEETDYTTEVVTDESIHVLEPSKSVDHISRSVSEIKDTTVQISERREGTEKPEDQTFKSEMYNTYDVTKLPNDITTIPEPQDNFMTQSITGGTIYTDTTQVTDDTVEMSTIDTTDATKAATAYDLLFNATNIIQWISTLRNGIDNISDKKGTIDTFTEDTTDITKAATANDLIINATNITQWISTVRDGTDNITDKTTERVVDVIKDVQETTLIQKLLDHVSPTISTNSLTAGSSLPTVTKSISEIEEEIDQIKKYTKIPKRRSSQLRSQTFSNRNKKH